MKDKARPALEALLGKGVQSESELEQFLQECGIDLEQFYRLSTYEENKDVFSFVIEGDE